MAHPLMNRRHLLLAGSAAALGVPLARAQAAWLEHTRHARTLRGALADEEQALDAKRGAASDGATQPDAKRHKIAS